MSTLKDSILTVGSGAHPTPFALEEATPYQDEEDKLTPSGIYANHTYREIYHVGDFPMYTTYD